METRANHLVIGAFSLAVIGALFFFVIWLAKVDIDREIATYRIYFDEAVSGLSVGSDVRYNGIPVGTVTGLSIDLADPSRVRATVEIGRATEIRADVIAKLELQGITGLSFIQLSGGSLDAPVLAPGPDGEPPVIASERSAIQELFAGAPDLINQVIVLVKDLQLLLGPENRKSITNIIANVADLSGRLADRGPEIEQLIVNMQETTGAMKTAAQQLDTVMVKFSDVATSTDQTLAVARGTLVTVDQVVDRDVRQTLVSIREASDRFKGVATQLEAMVAENREPLAVFTEDGLVQFTRFIEEARLLVASTGRLVEDIESDPAQFLFGGKQGGFEAQ
jgi:phospholipid/cholesterol/gamma-HCH transport system substrate-binding protein